MSTHWHSRVLYSGNGTVISMEASERLQDLPDISIHNGCVKSNGHEWYLGMYDVFLIPAEFLDVDYLDNHDIRNQTLNLFP